MRHASSASGRSSPRPPRSSRSATPSPGASPEAQTAYAEASALLAAMSDEELGARVDAAAYLTSAATYLDRYDEAVAHAERALRLGRAAGHLHPTLLPALGAAHFMRGRLAEAAKVLDDGVEAARLGGITQSMAWMLRNRALLSVVAGDLPAALEMAEEALELTQRLDESVLSSWAAMAVARASVMARAQPARGRRPRGGEQALRPIPGAWRAMGLEALATAYADLGRGDEAARAAAAAEAHAAALGLPMAIAWAQRAAATVALHAGEHGTAAERALASAAAAEEVGAVIEAALSRMLAGTRARRGRRDGPRGGSRSSARRRPSRHAAPFPTETPPSRSCAASGGACTAARGRAPPAPTAWPRSASASCRSPRSSSTARPTPRSQRSCSSA